MAYLNPRRRLRVEVAVSDAGRMLTSFQHAETIATERLGDLKAGHLSGDAVRDDQRLGVGKDTGFRQHQRRVRFPAAGDGNSRHVAEGVDGLVPRGECPRIHGDPPRHVNTCCNCHGVSRSRAQITSDGDSWYQ